MQAASTTPHARAPGDGDLADVVQVAKAAGDHFRAEILRALAGESFSVMELSNIFSVAQPAISHHLKILRGAGLVTQRKEGTSVFYQRGLPASPLLKCLFDELDLTPLTPPAARAVARIHGQRQQRCIDFFNNHAGQFRAHQALICEASVYVDSVMDLISTQCAGRTRSALELGPGYGDLLNALSQQFDAVTGIEQSPAMLELARKSANKNVDLHMTDFFALQDAHTHAHDALVAAMVLHHLPSPARFFDHARNYLRDTGLLVVAELCEHNQEWVREHCGDLWLGFRPEQLRDWLQAAGFNVISQQILAQKNGFVVQVLGAEPQ